MTGLMFEATKHAWSRMPRAATLIGYPEMATPEELLLWCDSADVLAEGYGVAAQYTEIAGELLALGEAPALARIAALWAARRYFGPDERVTSECDGPTDAVLEAQRLAFEADREEAETRRFYREDFPAIAAARGERVEDSPAWRMFAGAAADTADAAQVNLTGGTAEPAEPAREPRPCEAPSACQTNWTAAEIRDEYRRWWSTAERRFWDAEYQAAKPHAADDLEAARFATRRVLDRRIEAGGRQSTASMPTPPAFEDRA